MKLLHLACHPSYGDMKPSHTRYLLNGILGKAPYACEHAIAWPTKSIEDLQRLLRFLAEHLPQSEDLCQMVLGGAKLMIHRDEMVGHSNVLLQRTVGQS